MSGHALDFFRKNNVKKRDLLYHEIRTDYESAWFTRCELFRIASYSSGVISWKK